MSNDDRLEHGEMPDDEQWGAYDQSGWGQDENDWDLHTPPIKGMIWHPPTFSRSPAAIAGTASAPYQQDEGEQYHSEEDAPHEFESREDYENEGVLHHAWPPSQPEMSPSALPALQIYGTEPGLPSTQPDISEDFPEAFDYVIGGTWDLPGYDDPATPSRFLEDDPTRFDEGGLTGFLEDDLTRLFQELPYQRMQIGDPNGPSRPAGGSPSGGSVGRSSAHFQSIVSPHHLPFARGKLAAQRSSSASDSESDDGSQSDRGSVADEVSPSVQDPTSAPGPYQRGEPSGAQHAGQYLDPHQKRARESSSSSSGGYLRPQSKYHGDRGPGAPQGIPQVRRDPIQNIERDASLLGTGGCGPGVQAQAQGASKSYGDPNSYERGGASLAETQEISHAYATQPLPEPPPPNPFAGLRRIAPMPSPYRSGASRGYNRPSQGESSAQARGAGQSQPNPTQFFNPFKAPPQGSGHFQPNLRYMSASDIWRFINGLEVRGGHNEDSNWEGRLYKVDETKSRLWTLDQESQLKVILASFEDWDELRSAGQRLPGQRGGVACVNKASLLDNPRLWTSDQDADVRRLSSPRLEDRQAALERLLEVGRSKDEIVGRCMLFARSGEEINLGNTPQRAFNRARGG